MQSLFCWYGRKKGIAALQEYESSQAARIAGVVRSACILAPPPREILCIDIRHRRFKKNARLSLTVKIIIPGYILARDGNFLIQDTLAT